MTGVNAPGASTGSQSASDAQRKQRGMLVIVLGTLTMVVGVIVYAIGEERANRNQFCGFDGCEPSVPVVLAAAALVGVGMGGFIWGLQAYTGKSLAVPTRQVDPEPAPSVPAQSVSDAQPNTVSALAELEMLRDRGLITGDEFDTKRAAILERL